MLGVLTGDEFQTDAKLVAIVALGDICLQSDVSFLMGHIKSIISELTSAAQMSLNLGQDEDQVAIFSSLRTSIIECYNSILHGLPL